MLVYTKEIASDVLLGLWRMEERTSWDDCPQEVVFELGAFCAGRRQEVASTYSLLHAMMGEKGILIQHDSSGKPSIDGWNISISHTKGYVAIILSHSRNVAIDLEYINPRVNKIAGRFLRSDENAPDLLSRLVHWCAKETMYKYFSEQHLGFEEMRVRPFSVRSCGEIEAENMKTSKVLNVHYVCNDEYVMAWSY